MIYSVMMTNSAIEQTREIIAYIAEILMVPETAQRWKDRLKAEMQKLSFGGYGGFDHLCAAVLNKLKKEHAHIRLILVLPYLNSSMSADGYDETLYPPLESVPKQYAISRRNEWMAQESDAIIAYVTHSWGGAAKTLEYARRKKKNILLFGASEAEAQQ